MRSGWRATVEGMPMPGRGRREPPGRARGWCEGTLSDWVWRVAAGTRARVVRPL